MKPLISVSKMFQVAWDQYTANFSTYTILTLILVIPQLIFQGIKWGVLEKGSSIFGIVNTLGTIIVIACGIAASVSLVYAIADNAKQPWRVYYEKNFYGWKRYLVTNILRGLIVLAGFVLFIIPGIVFSIQFAVAEWIAMLEGKGGMDSLHGSRDLVRGRWWAVAIRFVAITAVSFVIAIVISFVGELFVFPTFVIESAFILILMPLSMIFSYVLYRDLTDSLQVELNTKPVSMEPAKIESMKAEPTITT